MIDHSHWASELAYVAGLITTDGSLSSDGRHIDLTSKDEEQIENFKSCLKIDHKMSRKVSGYSDKLYYRIQFSDVKFYRWLIAIGLKPRKTKTVSALKIPDQFFFDFLRGHFDGDGSCYPYWDKRWRSSFMIYLQFVSASYDHLSWIRVKVAELANVDGKIKKSGSVYQLTYAKKASKVIFERLYLSGEAVPLSRKRIKVQDLLIAEVAESVYAHD